MPARTWCVRNSDQWLWRTWGDESVVFNHASGDTHLLNLVESTGLQCLSRGACDAAELARRIAAELELPVDGELEQYAARLITRFFDLGLLGFVDAERK